MTHNTTSRWNGDFKYKTKDCSPVCPYYKNEKTEICLWGDAWKKLTTPIKLKKCSLKDIERPEHKVSEIGKEKPRILVL